MGIGSTPFRVALVLALLLAFGAGSMLAVAENTRTQSRKAAYVQMNRTEETGIKQVTISKAL